MPRKPRSESQFQIYNQPVQRAVVPSGTYTAAAAGRTVLQEGQITAAWNALDALVPTAEASAATGVAAGPAMRTATQNAYVLHPSPARWGSCVEEQLNGLDAAWNHQVALAGSRPDYGQTFGGIITYADLTTPTQAGPAGNHITTKLQTANILAGAAVAADITYTGGAAAPAAVPAWRVAAFGARQRHYASANGIGDAEYNPWAEENHVPSEADIWGWTQAQCNNYVATVDTEGL